jgi:hypothetical protein
MQALLYYTNVVALMLTCIEALKMSSNTTTFLKDCKKTAITFLQSFKNETTEGR